MSFISKLAWKCDKNWKEFRLALLEAIDFDMRSSSSILRERELDSHLAISFLIMNPLL